MTRPSDPNDKPEVAPESHFTWIADLGGYEVDGKGKGYFQYTGPGEETVIIPDEIDSHPMTSYYKMFYNTGVDVKKVVSTNPNVTKMDDMFQDFRGTSLDLSSFDISKVLSVSGMFENFPATAGYAITQAEANKFNSSSYKSAGLKFVVK